MKFRKADLLKLMAEREGYAKTCIASCLAVLIVTGVDCRNVITVGEPLKGLKADRAETYSRFGCASPGHHDVTGCERTADAGKFRTQCLFQFDEETWLARVLRAALLLC